MKIPLCCLADPITLDGEFPSVSGSTEQYNCKPIYLDEFDEQGLSSEGLHELRLVGCSCASLCVGSDRLFMMNDLQDRIVMLFAKKDLGLGAAYDGYLFDCLRGSFNI